MLCVGHVDTDHLAARVDFQRWVLTASEWGSRVHSTVARHVIRFGVATWRGR